MVRQQRNTLFGSNEIEIEEKSSLSLLVNEVCEFRFGLLNHLTQPILGHPSVLCLSNRQHHPVVIG